MKHLQYEHQNSLTECKAQALVSLKNAQDEHTEQEKELLRDKKNFKNNLREQENSYEDQIKNMRVVCIRFNVVIIYFIYISFNSEISFRNTRKKSA